MEIRRKHHPLVRVDWFTDHDLHGVLEKTIYPLWAIMRYRPSHSIEPGVLEQGVQLRTMGTFNRIT